MADPEHLRMLRKGVEKWNAWRRKSPEVRPDLRDADLTSAGLSLAYLLGANLSGAEFRGAELWGANLRGADLTRADLRDTNLRGADLTRANLFRANLRGANLRGAKLRGTDFTRANLRGANLRGAFLTHALLRGAELLGAILKGAELLGAELSDANLVGTDLTRAELWGTSFHQVDFRKAKGLEKVMHSGPSAVSSQTLEMSQGQVPDAFLKGCGFPDWMVLSARLCDPNLRPDEVIDLTYQIADLRTHAPIVPLSVFLSYAHEDKLFAAKVEQQLDKDGIRFWRDVHHLVAGPLEEQVDRAITINGAVLLILSEHSVDSDWVQWEAEKARELEKKLEKEAGGQPRHRLCPVALDDTWETCRWPGWLRSQIKQYAVLDFSTWDSDPRAFEAQYAKLKEGLGIYYRK